MQIGFLVVNDFLYSGTHSNVREQIKVTATNRNKNSSTCDGSFSLFVWSKQMGAGRYFGFMIAESYPE